MEHRYIYDCSVNQDVLGRQIQLCMEEAIKRNVIRIEIHPDTIKGYWSIRFVDKEN